MRQIDELKLVTNLEPATFTTMAEDGYARRRDHDLARVLTRAEAPARPAPRRRRVTSLTAGLTAAAAAVIAVVLAQVPAPHPGTHPRTGKPAVAAPVTARAFLLTSAVQAERTPAVSGTYWYIRTRDYTTTVAKPKEPAIPPGSAPARKKILPKQRDDFGARLAYSEDSWMGQDRARTITNEDVAVTFVTPAGEAAWKAAGSPPLMTADGTSRQPVTSDYHMSFHWGLGSAQFTWDDLRHLRTAGQLDAALRRMWDREPDKFGQFGSTSYSEYVFEWTAQLLTAPVQPAIRGAIYQLLAAQPGIINAGTVTVPDGRSGTGLAMSGGVGDFLIIDPGTAQAIAWGTGTLHQGQTITPASVFSLEEYETMGWTSQLGG
ncbi:MAG TPA: hypothetical protein VFQ68_35250 [Streptosporangiaceae bacterium]|nr:hypothetical protein [Streptosporangiaceae bacterium]